MSDAFRIDISGLRKTYGTRTVLDIDRLSLESGTTYALVGPNGSGKSTLLKVLAGAIDPTAGTVDVAGPLERDNIRVGFMPQNSYVFGFSVARNVGLALQGRGLDKAEVARRVEEALDAVGMSALAQERGLGLSGGEAQRVAFARMLVRDLDVLLLDEPTASMDIAGTLLVEQALAAYQRRTGCLVVVATHAPAQAHRIADRAVMLAEGSVVEHGGASDVLAHPQSQAGRAFLQYWQM